MIEQKTMLEWARFYADEWGVCVIPLREGKRPDVKWAEYQRRLPTPGELEGWFGGESPAWGMALVCGAISGNLVRFDFDDPADYNKLSKKSAIFMSGLAFKSQRKDGGYGIVFKNDIAIRKVPAGKLKGYPNLEIMGEGSITVIPPTPGYEWLDTEIEKLPNLELPRILLGHDLWRAEKMAPETPLDDEINELLENTVQGNRDTNLTQLVNIFRSRNLSLEIIKRIILPFASEWDHGDEPWDDDKIEEMIAEKFRRYEHQGSRYGKPSEFEAEFEDTIEDYSARREREEGPKPYLVDRLVLGEDMSNVVMAANAGEGKTTVCLGIALCMAQGRPVWGVLDVPNALKVVFIDQEEVRSQIRETIDMMAEVYGRPKRGMLTGLAGKGGHYSIGNPKSLELLERRLDRIRPDFIFLDGWQWFVDNKVSDRDFVGPALAWWKRIRGKYGCGTWIIHHNKKMGAPQFRPADPLELATGAKLLMDQARTKLIYEQMSGGLSDYGHLQGRCGRAEWNPISLVLEYDQTTQSHRMILRDEGEEIFDADQVKTIWGERPVIRKIKGLLNRLDRRGMNATKIAEFFGISHVAVSKWRSGQTQPSKDRLDRLMELAGERGESVTTAVTTRLHFDPLEAREMPSPIGVPIKNELKNSVHVSRDISPPDESISTSKVKAKKPPVDKPYGGKPGPNCGRCLLRDQPLVGGRGGAEGCVMLVGDGPGQTDAKSGKAYSGRTGIRLEKALRDAKIDPNLCRYTNAVACHVIKARKPTKKTLEYCKDLLNKELAEYKPKTVITLGEIAFAAFYPGKLSDFHGLRIKGEGYVLVPMYKPDAGDKSAELARLFVNDFHFLKDKVEIRPLEGEYRRATEFVPANVRVAVDTETTGLPLTSEIVGIGLCDTPGEASFLSKENGINSLREQPPEIATMANAKYDLGIFESNGLPMKIFKDVDDIMLLAYCMEKRPLGLKSLVLQELNLEMRTFQTVLGDKATFAEVAEDEATQYGCADPDGTLRLWSHLWKEADSRERKLYMDIEKPLPAILAKMELRGIDVDIKYLERLGRTVDEEMDSVAETLKAAYGLEREWLTSPKKMQDYIYGELKLPISALTDPDNPSTGRRILERMRDKHDSVNLILRYRELSTLKNTFCTGIINKARNGRIHPNFWQTDIVTGRVSSTEPNFQGIPSRRTSEFRKAIVAPEGFVVAAFDNSQIDLRALAYLSKCPVMNKLYDEDADIHAATSMLIYGDLEGTHRFEAKAANFMPVFGGTKYGLARRTGMTEDRAQDFLDKWYAHYTGVLPWINALRKKVLEDGYVDTVYGRRRHIPGVYTAKREHAFRQTQNSPIQGTSADVIKIQMIEAAKVAMPFAQIHDELVFYLLMENLDEQMAEIKSTMESVDCPFRLKVDASYGPNWGEQTKWKEAA